QRLRQVSSFEVGERVLRALVVRRAGAGPEGRERRQSGDGSRSNHAARAARRLSDGGDDAHLECERGRTGSGRARPGARTMPRTVGGARAASEELSRIAGGSRLRTIRRSMRSTYVQKDTPGRGGGSSTPGANTPMMEQFWRAKSEQPDALLFF